MNWRLKAMVFSPLNRRLQTKKILVNVAGVFVLRRRQKNFSKTVTKFSNLRIRIRKKKLNQKQRRNEQ